MTLKCSLDSPQPKSCWEKVSLDQDKLVLKSRASNTAQEESPIKLMFGKIYNFEAIHVGSQQFRLHSMPGNWTPSNSSFYGIRNITLN